MSRGRPRLSILTPGSLAGASHNITEGDGIGILNEPRTLYFLLRQQRDVNVDIHNTLYLSNEIIMISVGFGRCTKALIVDYENV